MNSKKLYCFITGEGENLKFIQNETEMNEGEAWEKALQNYNSGIKSAWQNNNWGKIELDDCFIWIKKRDQFDIQNEVDIEKAQKILNELKEELKNIKNIHKIIILVHAVDRIDSAVNQNCSKIDTFDVRWLYYTTAGGGAGVIECVKFIIQKLYSNDTSNLCKELSEEIETEEKKIEQEELEKHFTLLLYRIALIFLPLDIDLMGISEVEDDKKVDYFKDVLNDKEENYYKKKLVEFTCYVAGIKNVSINGSQLDANIEEDDFSGENCIKKIIEQSNFSEKSLKQNLCILSGIKDNQIDKESLLFKFMDLLDNKIEKKNTSNGLSKNDVDEILNFFNNKNWQVERVNPSQIKSFHDWFCAIMNCLEKIKTELSKKKIEFCLT